MALSVDEAKTLVIEFCATYPMAAQVSYKLRDTQEELYGPQATREAVGGILGSFRPGRRQADFATSNFRDADEFKETLRHEIIGHFGINTFDPAEKRAVLDGIIEARNEPGMSDLWDTVARIYPEASDSLKAEEVFAFACEAIEPQNRGSALEGNRSVRETCIERSRPMQIRDLINITTMVAEGMRDRSRSQQNFPESDNAQFKREEAMDAKKPFHEVVAERLIEQLKQGTAPWQMPWKAGDGGGMMPFNPTTGKRYKGINAIHLLSQGREDQRWLTYNQAKAEGAQVRKGEKSTAIQYWKFEEEQTKRDENNKPVLDGNGDPVKVRVRLERPKMFMANVFNAEQIDGLAEYQRPVQTWNPIERAETILQASGADIRHGGDKAYYRPSTDNIQMPNREQFPSADNYYATALHELGHWTGHGSRLDRDLSHPFGSEGYAKEELRAEIASMILGDELGIGHDPGQHASYVQSWIKVLQNDPMEIFRAASDAEKIQTFVLGLEQQQIHTQDQTQQPQIQGEPKEQGVGMRVPGEQQPNIQAEDWALRAIERPDLDQVVRRMTDEQLRIFDEVISSTYPLSNENEFWTRREAAMEAMFNNVDTVADNIDRARNVIGDEVDRREAVANRDQAPKPEAVTAQPEPQPLPELTANEQMVATALRNVRSEPEPLLKESFGRLLEATSSQALGYELPGNWSGATQVTGIARDSDGEGVHMTQDNETAEFYGLYARDEQGLAVWLADYKTETEALGQAERLAAIDAHAVVAPELQFRPDQDLLAEQIQSLEAREAEILETLKGYYDRYDADGAAVVMAESGLDELRETLQELRDQVAAQPASLTQQSQATAQATAEKPNNRTYIDVPFKEKNEAKEQGAKWDRQERSWYIPEGVDKAPFEHWLNPAPKVDTDPIEQAQGEAPKAAVVPKASREYLAVPYGEREAAKAAGAAYDKAAKSWYVGPNGDTAALARWKPENVANEQSPALDVREEFADAMRSVGLVVRGDHPIMDGKKHRVPVEGGKKGANDGFYVAFLDGHPAGSIINNKTSVNIKWKSKGYTLSDEQKAALQAEAASKLQAREAKTLKTQEAVAAKVTSSMASLVPVTEPTPYMVAKKIEPLPGVLTDKAGKQTVIPVLDVNGKQWSAQYIQKDGTKRYATDGRKEGCFHPLGGMDAVAAAPALVIGEGYATASSLASALGYATVAAFDSGNLPAVAKALHEQFPDKPVIIAGDDDRHLVMSHGTNAGRTKALEAAKAVGGKAIFPTFAPGEVQYPDSLPVITPQAFRKHVHAKTAVKELISEGGAAAGDPAQSKRAAELHAEMLTDEQVAALEKMKRLTDFNDLATKSALGREGLERQVRNAVGRVIEQHQVKVQQPQLERERVQGVSQGEIDQPKVRRAVAR
ncbi:zincin-like metallopeptidase domain-containing protein (plasmid) [Pseudomonas sp. WOUb67]|uniref:zincin-like metallopeptidase domain-containing protein n=1 Tax=Pseudomonas sp. WOUb67 TaxID=3161136 RepID=UPI003CEA0510